MSVKRTKPFRAGLAAGKVVYSRSRLSVPVSATVLARQALPFARLFGLSVCELPAFLVGAGYGYHEAETEPEPGARA